MNKEILEAVTGEVRKLLEAGSCCKEAKDAAQAWLDAVGTDKESEQAKKLLVHAESIKAAGAKYCDCPACAACEKILAHKDELIG